MGRGGGGQVVSLLAFNSNNLSSNPAQAYSFSCKFVFEINKKLTNGLGWTSERSSEKKRRNVQKQFWRKPWSSGYGSRLMIKKTRVQIPAPDTGRTVFHINLL